MKYFLAPMGGISKLPFRRLCLQMGADLVWSEQINAASLLQATQSYKQGKKIHVLLNEETLLLEIHEQEKHNIVIQMASNQALEASQAVSKVKHLCYGIDLNMDPPVPDPKGTGIGKNLLLNPSLASKIIEQIHMDHPEIKIFFKMRMLSTPAKTIEFINLMKDSGAHYLILHMRKIEATLQEPLASLEQVKEIIPFGLCGGFFRKESILELGNDSIMLGRGAAHYPGIFAYLKNIEPQQQVEEVKFDEQALREKIKSLNDEHPTLRPLLGEEQLHYKMQYPQNFKLLPYLQKLQYYMNQSDMTQAQIKFLFSYILKSHSELAHIYFGLQTGDLDQIELC